MKKLFTLFFSFAFAMYVGAQQKATLVVQSAPVVYVPSLASRAQLPPAQRGKTSPIRNFRYHGKANKMGLPVGIDPLWRQNRQSTRSSLSLLSNFQATDMGGYPSDPTGAVGSNHYVVAYNFGFKIFDKNGNVLVNDTSLSSLFPSYNVDGDPIVLYDRFADRFLITAFDVTSNPNKLLVAISQGSNPVTSGWNLYAFNMSSLPDYPKYSIWSDGYYITANKDAGAQASNQVVFVLDRTQMINGSTNVTLVGLPLPGIVDMGFYSPAGFNVVGNTLPPTGNAPIIYMQDDSWTGVSNDHLKIWNINVNWFQPGLSTISQPVSIPVTAFNSEFVDNQGNMTDQNLMQPNNIKIDALQGIMMYMTNYRRFSDHNSVVCNFVVNTDGNGKAGIRWYELRQTTDGQPWTVYQEGTYADASYDTFCGSINMDRDGNIALGYTVVSASKPPELRFTGRYASDPLGSMTFTPTVITTGVQSSTGNRYGDYAQMTIDPNDTDFWHIGEYFNNNKRICHVGVFRLVPNNDVGVASIISPTSGVLGNNIPIQIGIKNFGVQPQSGFNVSYQIDGGAVVTENYGLSIPGGQTAVMTFSTPANMNTPGHTYHITAWTSLQNDQNTANDATTSQVTYLQPDVAIVDVTSPQTAMGLTPNESISIVIQNNGGTLNNLPVSYSVNGAPPINEVVPGTIASGAQFNYSFTQPADFSIPGLHHIVVDATLNNDSDISNNHFEKNVQNLTCLPQSNCANSHEIARVKLADIDNSSACGNAGYSDYCNITGHVVQNNNYNTSIYHYGGNLHFSIWIDGNDDSNYTPDELIVTDYTVNVAPGSLYASTFSIHIPLSIPPGEHLMRIRMQDGAPVPDACAAYPTGETEDYLLDVAPSTGIDALANEHLLVKSLDDNHFDISFETSYDKEMFLSVYNTSGQLVFKTNVFNIQGKYHYHLNLSTVSKGMYLLRLGNDETGKIVKLLVK